jgi:D-beta-D-heptose 7-phosphate kinase/D-beta-D-heptose 1-phosphate adenosyltransferase
MEPLKAIESKITDLETLLRRRKSWEMLGKKVVFTNGCFDLLHQGHVDYLARAKGAGDILIVGINSDASISGLKGPSRPIAPLSSRQLVMASLHAVDIVIPFEEETPIELIKAIKPDVMVKGADYKPEEVVGGDFVIENGGELVLIPIVDGFSTSQLIEKIKTDG